MNVLLSGIVGSGATCFTRSCPSCNSELRYRNKGGCARAERQGVRCRICARRAQVQLGATEKTCTYCGETKPVGRFVVNTKRRLAGITAQCKDCENARFAAKRAELARRVNALKEGKPCTDCGGIYPPVCLDFDHLPQFQKRLGVARMVGTCRSWAAIEAEIAKCELVCANCHRLRTDSRGYAR